VIWQSPWWLLALVVVPALAVAAVVWERSRRRAAGNYADPALMDVGAPPGRRRLRRAAIAVGLLAVACGPVALARPSLDRTEKERRGAVVIAIDESRSMLKTDLQPTRLQGAIAAAERFLDVAPKKTAVGLIFFSKAARIVVPPVTDRDVVRRSLSRYRVGVGTAIGDAVVAGLASLRGAGVLTPPPARPEDSAGRILLLTDGAQSAGTVEPPQAAERARAARVPVYTFLLGNDPGRPDQASPPETLASLATQTGGAYSQNVTTADLETVVENIGEQLAPVRRLEELTVYVVLLAVVLLALAALLAVLATRTGPGRSPATFGAGSGRAARSPH
jgi:Ca-activated chloride channel family protein